MTITRIIVAVRHLNESSSLLNTIVNYVILFFIFIFVLLIETAIIVTVSTIHTRWNNNHIEGDVTSKSLNTYLFSSIFITFLCSFRSFLFYFIFSLKWYGINVRLSIQIVNNDEHVFVDVMLIMQSQLLFFVLFLFSFFNNSFCFFFFVSSLFSFQIQCIF